MSSIMEALAGELGGSTLSNLSSQLGLGERATGQAVSGALLMASSAASSTVEQSFSWSR